MNILFNLSGRLTAFLDWQEEFWNNRRTEAVSGSAGRDTAENANHLGWIDGRREMLDDVRRWLDEVRREISPERHGMCCRADCINPAEWQIVQEGDGDYRTESCTTCVGALLSVAVAHRVYRIGDVISDGE